MSDEPWREVGSCDHCMRINIPVCFEPDPFIAELYPEDENLPSSWCEDCFTKRKDEV